MDRSRGLQNFRCGSGKCESSDCNIYVLLLFYYFVITILIHIIMYPQVVAKKVILIVSNIHIRPTT